MTNRKELYKVSNNFHAHIVFKSNFLEEIYTSAKRVNQFNNKFSI